MGIIGGLLFTTPSNFMYLHTIFGLLLILAALMQIILHSSTGKQGILMKRPFRDFKGFVHSLFYLIGFSKIEEHGGGEKYYGRQRMVFLALAYGIGLMAISGFALYAFSSQSVFRDIMILTHVLAAGLIYLVLLYHLAINIRKHDYTELQSSFVTGKLPLWHIKKHHKIWYHEILKHEKAIVEQQVKYRLQTQPDPVVEAIIDMAASDNIRIPDSVAEEMANRIKKNNDSSDVDSLIRYSKAMKYYQ
jgi:cytochrome b subunit of formate dehydrogenase